jgi:TPR repeat protein
VSRTNISILLATALLGVLLWIVISIVRDIANAPDIPMARPTATESAEPDLTLPRLTSRAQLEDWLTKQGHPVQSVEAYRDWLELRGFLAAEPMPEFDGSLPATDSFIDQDDATLLQLAGEGDLGALHALAERSLETDPLAALEWFDQAIINGSVYAMVRSSDLLATLADPGLSNFVSDPVWQAALNTMQNTSPPPLERALAWAIAAVTFGGYAVLDQGLAEKIGNLNAQMDPAAIGRACELAQEYVLETAATRRAKGSAVFATLAPPLAFSVAQPEAVISCDVPVLPLVSLDQCSRQTFVGPDATLNTAWLCTTGY